MIYEMRVYRSAPGKLPALLKRFETVTIDMMKQHGIRPFAFFTTVIGASNHELTYYLAWESLAEREQKMAAFSSDPDWLAARAKTEVDGPLAENITNQILAPTVFSPLQ